MPQLGLLYLLVFLPLNLLSGSHTPLESMPPPVSPWSGLSS
jgi:ABC-2 type transport system permease protein